MVFKREKKYKYGVGKYVTVQFYFSEGICAFTYSLLGT